MYLTHDDLTKSWVFDLETDGLEPTRIWCMVAHNLGTGEFVQLWGDVVHDAIWRFFDARRDCNFVGHNIVGYDNHALSSLVGVSLDCDRLVDTLVLSRLYNPHLDGGHSLAAWAERLGLPAKLEHEDWSQFSQAMLDRCVRDVAINVEVFKQLTARMREVGFSEQSCRIETRFADVIAQQRRNGIWFDVRRATDFLSQLRLRQSDLTTQIQSLFPPRLVQVAVHQFRRRADGSPFVQYGKHVQKYHRVDLDEVAGVYTCWDFQAFNIGSPVQRIQRLLEGGWEPSSFTPKGSPKIDEDALRAYATASGRPEIEAIAEWLVLAGRTSMLEGWLNNVNPKSHRIHGYVNPCGASSRRCTHDNPNTANVPSASNGAKYGDECRSLWGVQPGQGRVLLGYDAKGLETRGLCHVINTAEATDLLLNGDVHGNNAKALTDGLGFEVVRGGGGAKTLFYAFIYGAYPNKLGSIIKKDKATGEKVAAILGQSVPGLGEAIERAKWEYRQSGGLLRCVDGGFVRCPSESAALNYKIQPLGAVVMKLAAVLLDTEIVVNQWDALKVLDVHDEGQLDVAIPVVDAVGSSAVRCIVRSGEILNLNVPMDGSYSIGQTWAETH